MDLWGRLVKKALATSVGGPAQSNGEQDAYGAYGWASIGDQKIGTAGRIDQGLSRAEAPSREADVAPPQTELGVWVALGRRIGSLS